METITFNKGKRQFVKNNPSNNSIPEEKLQGPCISINLFNANTCKYIDTQVLQYKSKESTNKNKNKMNIDNTTLPVQNHFTILNEEHMVLDKFKKNENNITPNTPHAISHLDSLENDVALSGLYVHAFTNNENHDMLLDINEKIINSNKTTKPTRQTSKQTIQPTTNTSITDQKSKNPPQKYENINPQSMLSTWH